MASRQQGKQYRPVIDPRKMSEVGGAEQQLCEQYLTGKSKGQADIALIKKCLSDHHVFATLEDHEIDLVLQDMEHYLVPAGTNLFEAGTPGLYFFIVAHGFLQVIVGTKVVNMLTQGEGFGELALMHDSPRSANIRVKTDAELWGLSRFAFRGVTRQIQLSNYENMKKFLNGVPLFKKLGKNAIEAILHALTLLKFDQGQTIVHEGDPGDVFYLIVEGTVVASQEGVGDIRTMTVGQYFGEMSLLFNEPRSATIRATSKVKAISLGRNDIAELFGEELQPILYRNSMRIAMEKNRTLQGLTREQQTEIIGYMQIKNYNAGEIVIDEGQDMGAFLWIVLNGQLNKSRSGDVIAKSTCIGEECMTIGQGNVMDEPITANKPSAVASISHNEFEEALGGGFNKISDVNQADTVLRSMNLFRRMPQATRMRLIQAMQVNTFTDGQAIFEQGATGDQFFIIKDGTVDVLKDNKHVRDLTKSDYFGERALITNDVRSMTIKAKGNVECWILSKSTFMEVVHSDRRNSLIDRMTMQDLKLALPDVHIVKTLGSGSFGDVYLACGNSREHLFALKSISKNKVVQYQLFESINLERELLLSMNHDMILSIYNTYKTDKYVFLLTEYVRGMDLFDAIREMDILNNEQAQFYTVCLMDIFEYLHDRMIIYRDLKPENIMVDHEGYPKLIDFGTAKFINGRTFTIVGTPHYMAPDVIQGKGYGFEADYWSIGVILYELLCGGLPFGNDEPDPYNVYDLVLKKPLTFPRFLGSNFPAKEFIQRLLDRNPIMRVGGKKGPLKKEAWLAGVNWDNVQSKQLTPPFVPPGQLDMSEIDRTIRANEPADVALKTLDKSRGPMLAPPKSHANWDAQF